MWANLDTHKMSDADEGIGDIAKMQWLIMRLEADVENAERDRQAKEVKLAKYERDRGSMLFIYCMRPTEQLR